MDAQRSRRSAGFTLIEVILTVALIAMLGTMFVVNIGSLLRRSELETLQVEFWRAVDDARVNAVFRQTAYYLTYDEKARAFVVDSGADKRRFEVDTAGLGRDVEIEVAFQEVAPENSYVLIRGELVTTRDIDHVGFFPDGTCSPFTVSLRIDDFESRFQIDPWTGAQLVDPGANET